VLLTLGGVTAATAQQTVPIELDEAVVAEITANYRACLAEELAAVDDNGNGKLDADEDAQFFADGEAYCQEELEGDMAHATEIASLRAEQAALQQRAATARANIEALTDAIIAGAQADFGLNP